MKISASFCIPVAILAITSSVNANSILPAPVPLYGTYNMELDRSKQTFNGHHVTTDRPLRQTENFTTHCDTAGCVAHSLNKRPPPASFDYLWTKGHWESVAGQQRQYLLCNDGSKVNSVKVDIIKPNGDGTFSGERTIIVKGAGCPGDGPGKYWLPFTLTPTK
jgi:hypothetical protein